jgi:hypothetical protein
MWVQLTNRDSTGRCPTRRLVVTVDGDRYERFPADNGAFQLPASVGEQLVESDSHGVVRYAADDDSQ